LRIGRVAQGREQLSNRFSADIPDRGTVSPPAHLLELHTDEEEEEEERRKERKGEYRRKKETRK